MLNSTDEPSTSPKQKVSLSPIGRSKLSQALKSLAKVNDEQRQELLSIDMEVDDKRTEIERQKRKVFKLTDLLEERDEQIHLKRSYWGQDRETSSVIGRPCWILPQ